MTDRMFPTFAYAVMIAGLVLAIWAGIQAYRRLAADIVQVVGALLLEATLAVQSGIAVIRIIGGHQVAEPATFIAYSLGVLAPLPLGIYLARIERTRWGSLAVCFTAIVVAVMTLRLLQLWRMGLTDV